MIMTVGTKVQIVAIIDETGDLNDLGRCGLVVDLIVNDHGASLDDPLLIVQFDHSKEKNAFWIEETKRL